MKMERVRMICKHKDTWVLLELVFKNSYSFWPYTVVAVSAF